MQYFHAPSNEIRDVLSYDPNIGEFRWRKTIGRRAKAGDMAGTVHPQGYRIITINRRRYWAAKLAWWLYFGKWPEFCIDHINGDRADNRIVNLRAANRRNNSQNSRPHANKECRYKGVSWKASHRKWSARITVAGKTIDIGCFGCPKEAARAYDRAARDLFGQFAWLNFPDGSS